MSIKFKKYLKTDNYTKLLKNLNQNNILFKHVFSTTSISLLAVAVKKKYLNKMKRTALMGSAAYVGKI
jgi:hypothetical protein